MTNDKVVELEQLKHITNLLEDGSYQQVSLQIHQIVQYRALGPERMTWPHNCLAL